jgi:hypothetical protein
MGTRGLGWGEKKVVLQTRAPWWCGRKGRGENTEWFLVPSEGRWSGGAGGSSSQLQSHRGVVQGSELVVCTWMARRRGVGELASQYYRIEGRGGKEIPCLGRCHRRRFGPAAEDLGKGASQEEVPVVRAWRMEPEYYGMQQHARSTRAVVRFEVHWRRRW